MCQWKACIRSPPGKRSLTACTRGTCHLPTAVTPAYVSKFLSDAMKVRERAPSWRHLRNCSQQPQPFRLLL